LQTQLEIAELIELNDEQLFQLMNRKSESKQNSIDLKTFKANTKNLLRNPFYASILSKTLYQEQSQDSVKLLSYFVSIRIKEITRYGISGESALLFLERLGYTCVLLRKTLFDFKFILKILERISDQQLVYLRNLEILLLSHIKFFNNSSQRNSCIGNINQEKI
jgi:hypothetical protein